MRKSIDGQGKTPAVDLSASSNAGAAHSHGAQTRRRPPSALLHRLSLAAVLQTRHAEPALLRYLSGLAAWIITFALRLLIRPLTPYSPFLLFIPGLMLVAWLWGRGPALLYLATTAIAVSIYFVPGAGLFRLDDATHLATALQFIVVGSAVIYIVGRLVAARLEIDRQLKNVSQLSSQQQTLLDEINHRVKNHLQAIIALTPAGQDERIDQIRVRMLVLARVYDKLTLRAAGATVDAENFLAELTSDFQNSLAPTGSIQLSHSVACGPLGSKEAVFIGLIANEAVSNALKYAFPHRRGTIHLSLQERLGKRTLVVRDDGAGDAGKTKGTGQGRRLMGRLAKDLGGEVRIEGPPGYSVNVSYPLSALAS
jgi:two-component system, sensor histidine kinase PdtaS